MSQTPLNFFWLHLQHFIQSCLFRSLDVFIMAPHEQPWHLTERVLCECAQSRVKRRQSARERLPPPAIQSHQSYNYKVELGEDAKWRDATANRWYVTDNKMVSYLKWMAYHLKTLKHNLKTWALRKECDRKEIWNNLIDFPPEAYNVSTQTCFL